MPLHELINGLVPGAPVGSYRWGVPPVGVELAVAEARYLREGIEEGLEEREEAGEPDDEGYGTELHDAFENGGEV